MNLRCMELTSTGADLFVGGGITAKSDPEKEWTETELKSQTMLSVISS
ncbi:MAG: chorismate-binding protein [Bacteroidota bacterium]